jgi:hypothetical protein
MKSTFIKQAGIRVLLLFILSLFAMNNGAYAQNASQYGFSAVAGTYTDIAGTPGIVIFPTSYLGDDNTIINVPIGFPFTYCGTVYNTVAPCTNGWLSFNPSMTTAINQWTNSLANLGGTPSIKPALMPLWDDLGASSTSSPVGEASYVTTGSAPNRIFTFQYKNWQWTVGSSVNISFQVKLYETTNVIEYIYKQETAAGSPSSATIGIVDALATPTYLTLNNSTTAPVPSSTTFNTSIATKPATGQIYRFIPPISCSAATGMPTAGTVTASPASLCLTGNVTLNFTPTTALPPVVGITYKWQSSPTAAGTYTDIPGAVTTLPTYTTTVPITANTYYKAVMLCNTTTTVLTSSASNQVVVNNPGTPTGIPGSRCGPGSVALSATGPAGTTLRWYDAATGGAPLFTGANFNTPFTTATRNFYVSAGSAASPTTSAVGAGALTSSGSQYLTIFAGGWGGYKHQFLISESEMIAAGIFPGSNISSIAVENANGTATYNGFTMSLKSTPVTVLTTTFETGATPVFGPIAVTTVVGTNTFTFGSPYTYTGGSLLIETCWSNGTTSNPYSYLKYDNTTFASTHYAYQDSQTPATICAGPINNGTPENTRPQFKFNFDGSCQGNRVPVQATINTSPVVTRTSPPVVCNNAVATVTLTPPTPAYPSYKWTPVTNLFTDPAATTPYVLGSSATTVYMKTNSVGQQTYYMMAGDPTATTGCTFADTVKIHVQPGNVKIKGQPDTICVSGTTKLSLDTIAGYFPGTIQWQSSTNGTTYTDIAGATNPIYVTPSLAFGQNTYFKAVIKAGTSICETPVKYVVIANPTIISAPDSFHCGPGPVTLNATTGGNGSAVWYTSATGGLPIASGSPFITPFLGTTTSYYVSSGAGGTAGSPVIGAGGSTSSSYVSPFYHLYGGQKNQYLIRASELTAAGIPAGANITSIALDVVTSGTVFQGFAVSMAQTTATALTTTGFVGNLTTVRPAANYTPTTGINTLTFTAPYPWDGTSSLVIQTCWSNNNGGGTSNTVKYDATAYAATSYQRTDNVTPAVICGNTAVSAVLSQRPKFTINYDNRCESSREEVVAYIRPVPVVNLGPDINKCVDAGIAEVLDAGVQANNPVFQWDNGSASQVRAVTESGTYTVKVTNQYTCSDADTINVILRPNPIVNLGNDTTVCNGVVLNLNPGNSGVEYFWNNGQNTQNINVTNPGTYSVFVTNSQGCTKADTIVVSMVGELPTVSGIQQTNNGQYTFTFTAVNPLNVIGYDWDFGDDSAHSYQASPTHTYANDGNYVVILRLSSSCGFATDSLSTHILAINQLNVDKNEMTVYPNPTKEVATILNRGALKMENVSVYNVFGQVVYKAKADSKDKHTLHLSGFASGIYTIEIFTDKGAVARKLEIIK